MIARQRFMIDMLDKTAGLIPKANRTGCEAEIRRAAPARIARTR